MSKSGIYKIFNKINNVVYIGSSINILKRWKEHIRLLNNNKHDNQYLQNSWNKYGSNAFIFEILESVDDINSLSIIEQSYLDKYIPFNRDEIFNICEYTNKMLGYRHTDEAKEKMSKHHKGNKYSLGHKHTDETKEKMSLIKKGKKQKNSTKGKIKIKSLNRKVLEETKIKLSEKSKTQKNKSSKKVIQLDTNDNLIKIWDSLTEAAESVNTSTTQICGVCSGRHITCRGYKWKYLDENKNKKISTDLEIEIKLRYETTDISIRGLAVEYNLSKGVVYRIVKSNILP